MTLKEEAALVEQAKHDSKAFSTLYEAYYTPIYRYVLHRTADVPSSLDITSNVFFKALTSIRKYDWRDIPFSAWLYKIAGNEVTDYFRHKKRSPISLDMLITSYDFEPISMTDIQEELMQTEKEIQQHKDFLTVHSLMLTLNPDYQEVLILRYYEKKKVKEIACILGKSEGTIKSQLSRGVALLQKKLSEEITGKESEKKMQPIPAVSVLPLRKTYEKTQ